MSENDINRWHADLRRFSEPKRLANGLVDFNRWEPAPITDEMLAELTQLFSYSGAPWNCRSLPLSPSDREYMYLLYCSMQGLVSRMRQSDAFAAELLDALQALFSLHEPEGRFQPSHFKPVLRQAREAISKATGDPVEQVGRKDYAFREALERIANGATGYLDNDTTLANIAKRALGMEVDE